MTRCETTRVRAGQAAAVQISCRPSAVFVFWKEAGGAAGREAVRAVRANGRRRELPSPSLGTASEKSPVGPNATSFTPSPLAAGYVKRPRRTISESDGRRATDNSSFSLFKKDHAPCTVHFHIEAPEHWPRHPEVRRRGKAPDLGSPELLEGQESLGGGPLDVRQSRGVLVFCVDAHLLERRGIERFTIPSLLPSHVPDARP